MGITLAYFKKVLLWTALYSAQIFIFALLYNALPQGLSFHQSNAEYELPMRRQLGQTQAILHDAFVRSKPFREALATVDTRPGSLSIEVGVDSLNNTNALTVRVFVSKESKKTVNLQNGRNLQFKAIIETGRVVIVSACSQCLEEDQILKHTAMFLDLIPEELQVFYNIANEQLGNMTDEGDRFIRLLYFSAITAATIGYGDIVPTSNAARLIASVQALVAIVMIGLFVNSLSQVTNMGTTVPQLSGVNTSNQNVSEEDDINC